ncbi:MAG: putative transposase [Verrucomicrobiales bacterium]|jgi:putative transposase
MAKAKGGFSRARIEEELKNGGSVPVWQVLRCRVRYFSDGAVLGSKGFVDEFFERERSRFGPNRESGARRIQGAALGAVMSLRKLG